MKNLLISLAFIFALIISFSTDASAQRIEDGAAYDLGGITHIFPLQTSLGHGTRGNRIAEPSNINISIFEKSTEEVIQEYETSYALNHEFTIPESHYNNLESGVYILTLSIGDFETGRVQFTIE